MTDIYMPHVPWLGHNTMVLGIIKLSTELQINTTFSTQRVVFFCGEGGAD